MRLGTCRAVSALKCSPSVSYTHLVCQTFVVQDAWERAQPVTVHGWIYGLKDGLMRDLGFTVPRREDLLPRYAAALEALQV